MRSAAGVRAPRPARTRELDGLRARLAEAEQTLHAIRVGEVDAVVVAGEHGPQVFTLEGTEHAYRVLIERMNEGALIAAADTTILYANECFARMVRLPLERVIGGSLRRFLDVDDRAIVRTLRRKADEPGSKVQSLLHSADGSRTPVQVAAGALPKDLHRRAAIGLVVTDLTDARRTEEMLRALTHRVVHSQEEERARVALELHDHVTQLLCGVLFRCKALSDGLAACDGKARREVTRLRKLIRQTADEVERISRGLRPGVLAHLGLVAVLRSAGERFTERTGVSVKLVCARLTAPLPADAELSLYRVFQQALANVEQHSHARHVAVELTRRGPFLRLTIADDGRGFDPDPAAAGRAGAPGLGLLGMRERALSVGGDLRVQSVRGKGTTIRVRIPVGIGAA